MREAEQREVNKQGMGFESSYQAEVIVKARYVGLALVVLLLTGGVAWAGQEAYRIVMSKDKELCEHVLQLVNADIKKYQSIRYQEHEVFSQIPWERIDKPSRFAPECSFLRKAIFDINNDGRDELVIKFSGCLRSQLIDSLYIFPQSSTILSKLKPDEPGGLSALFSDPDMLYQIGDLYVLSDLKPEKTEGLQAATGVVEVNPFVWRKTSYISIADLYPEWIVITKYVHRETFQDYCYFHGPSFSNP